jgi:hypothetical protein
VLATRVSGASTGAFSNERVFIQRLAQESAPAVVVKRKRRYLTLLLPLATLFIALLFQVVVRIQIIHAGYLVSEKRQRALELDRELRELRSELAVATSPRVLMTRAEKELGLTVTPPQRLRTIVRYE